MSVPFQTAEKSQNPKPYYTTNMEQKQQGEIAHALFLNDGKSYS